MSFKYFVLQEMIEMKELSGKCLKFKAPGRSKMVALFIVDLSLEAVLLHLLFWMDPMPHTEC